MSIYDYNDAEFNVNENDLLFLDDELDQFLASLAVSTTPQQDEWEERAYQSSMAVFDAICDESIRTGTSFQNVVLDMANYDPVTWEPSLLNTLNKDAEVWQEKYPDHDLAHVMVGIIVTTGIMTATGDMPDPFYPSRHNKRDDGHYSF